jgi:hypothetical protein
MLAMANRDGIVEAAVPGLASRAKVTNEECLTALELLAAPDNWSRSKEFDGRRIAAIDGGWKILNHAKYRAKLSLEERRIYKAEKQAEYRAQKTKGGLDGKPASQAYKNRETAAVRRFENGDENALD